MLAVALVAASTPGAGPPVGSWTYVRESVGPAPALSVALVGQMLVVKDFAGDRAFTTTTARYDVKTLQLLSADQHASCCGGSWTLTVLRGGRSYDISTTRLATVAGTSRSATIRQNLRRRFDDPVIVGSIALLPWMYSVRHVRAIEHLSIAWESSEGTVDERSFSLAEDTDADRPARVPAADRALRVGASSGGATLVWYDPRTFVPDAYRSGSALVVRTEL